MDNLITTKFNDVGLNINAFIQVFVPKFSLVLGAIFGGIAFFEYLCRALGWKNE
ncbi:MAG: hypothetical protein ACTSXO_11520 [Candidatus Heimdallarchaeota archaeon]